MNTVEHNIYGRGTVYCYSYRYGTVCSYCMLVQYQYELQYYSYNRAQTASQSSPGEC